MSLNIVKGMDTVSRNVKKYIAIETATGGLLEDVETVINSVNSDIPVDPPCVWIVEHPTIPYDNNNLSNTQRVVTTFEFVCVEHDDDLEIAQIKGENLATRVGACILKNLNNVRDDEDDPIRVFDKVVFKALYPVGEVSVVGKQEKIPATSIIFEFIHTFDWLKCKKIKGE